MNLLSRIEESGPVLRPSTSSSKRELPVDQILMGDCIAEMARLPDKSVDMIFADPPYMDPAVPRLAADIAASRAAGPDTVIAIEHSRRVELEAVPGVLELLKTRRHGDTCISIYRPTAVDGAS